MTKMLTCVMTDGTKWGVPVEIIARNRATHWRCTSWPLASGCAATDEAST